jgi:hypothetical protein
MHNIFQKEKLKIWHEEIKQIIHNNNSAYTNDLTTKQLEDETDYKRQTAIAKREIRRRHRQSWETFISHLESDLYKVKPKAFKILKYMNQDIKELAKLNCEATKEQLLKI